MGFVGRPCAVRAGGAGMLAGVLVTNHVLSGALIAAAGPLSRRPAAAFAAGVASHFALDAIPHWGDQDPAVFWRVAVRDGLIGLAAMALMTALAPRERRAAVLAGMAGAAFPDLDKPGRELLGRSPFPRAVDAFHAAIQRESTRRMPQELIVGAATAAATALLLRRR